MEPINIVRRFEALESERKDLDTNLEDVSTYVCLNDGGFFQSLHSENEIKRNHGEVLDITANNASQLLASKINGNLTSPSTRWFEIRFQDDEMNDNVDAKEWIEEVSNIIFMTLQESNFNLQAAELYYDLVSFGTTAIVEEVEGNKVVFANISIRDFYFEETYSGGVARFYHREQLTPYQIVDKHGIENVPQSIVEKMSDEKTATEKMDVIKCIYYREEVKGIRTDKPLPPEMRPVGCKYVLKETAEMIGTEDGYYEMPVFIPRWRKETASKWGRSPARDALPDVLSINSAKADDALARAKTINPPVIVSQRDVLSDIDLEAGGMTVLKDINGIKVLESGFNHQISMEYINVLTENIRQVFFVDSLELKQSPAMTATEVNARREQIQQSMSITIGRLSSEFLEPLIMRTFAILQRLDQLPQFPELQLEKEPDFQIEYTSPLPRAMKAGTAGAIAEVMGMVGQMAQVYPEAVDIIDQDDAVRTYALLKGAPAKMLLSENKVNKKRQQRAQQQQAAMQAQMQAQEAMIAKDTSVAMKNIADSGVADQMGGQ